MRLTDATKSAQWVRSARLHPHHRGSGGGARTREESNVPWLDEAQGLELSPGLFLAVVGAMYVVAMPAALLLTSRWLRQAQTRHRPAGAPPHPDTWPTMEESGPVAPCAATPGRAGGWRRLSCGRVRPGHGGARHSSAAGRGAAGCAGPADDSHEGVLVAAAAIVLPPMLLVYTMERARLQWQRDRADNEQP